MIQKTGKRIRQYTGKTRWDKNKKEYVPVTREITKMENVDDAFELVGDKKNPHEKEVVYATYANNLKALGNESRKLSLSANKEIHVDSEAAKSILRKLNL